MIYGKYSVVLKTILDTPEGSEAIEKALSTYPLYTPDKHYDMVPNREQLNQRLLNHYKYKEIGFETVGRFLDELEITMNEIMPYYNEMLKTVVTMAELPSPFDNVDVVEKVEETRTSNSESTRNDSNSGSVKSEADNKRVHTDTPQNQLSTPAKDIDTINYASDVEWNADNSNQTTEGASQGRTTGSDTSTFTHTYTKTGNQGVNTYAHDMNEFRTSIIDVVDQLINDHRIVELFMMVY